MTSPHLQLARWIPASTPLTRHIVREILKRENRPLHNREIWELSQGYKLSPKEASLHKHDLEKYAPIYKVDPARRKLPPNPEHPIRSLRYLKSFVLHDLQERGEIVRICIRREPTPQEKAQVAMQPAVSRKKRNLIALKSGQKQPPMIVDGLVREFKWRLADPDELSSARSIFEAKESLIRQGERRVLDQIKMAQNEESRRKAELSLMRFGQSVKNGTWGAFKNIRPRKTGQDENGFLVKET